MQYKSRRSITSAKNCDSSLLTTAEKKRTRFFSSSSSKLFKRFFKKNKKLFFPSRKTNKNAPLKASEELFSQYNLCQEKVGSSQFIIDILISKLQPSHCSENLIFGQIFNVEKHFLDRF